MRATPAPAKGGVGACANMGPFLHTRHLFRTPRAGRIWIGAVALTAGGSDCGRARCHCSCLRIGILRKTLPAGMLVKCLQKVHKGELWFEKALTDSFLTAERVVLSRREGQLVTLLSCGLKNTDGLGPTPGIASLFARLDSVAAIRLGDRLGAFGVHDQPLPSD
jgi:hypothetical protein